MAFGIDDALSAAAAGISLTDTIARTIQNYSRRGETIDLERLLGEVRLTAVQKIDEADLALAQLERLMVDKGVDVNMRLADIVGRTPFWQPFEQHRLKQIFKTFNGLSDSIYSACDDVAALARCRETTAQMGEAVVVSAVSKHELHSALINASSFYEAIQLLRRKLVEQKAALG